MVVNTGWQLLQYIIFLSRPVLSSTIIEESDISHLVMRDKNNTLILKKKIDFKVDKIICESFTETSKIRNIYISDTSNKKLTNNDLTSDNRHFKSTIIKLVKKNQFCY